MVKEQMKFKKKNELDMLSEAVGITSSIETTMKVCEGCQQIFKEVGVVESITVSVGSSSGMQKMKNFNLFLHKNLLTTLLLHKNP